MDLSLSDNRNFTRVGEYNINIIKDSANRSNEKAIFSTIRNRELDNLVNNNKDPLIEEYSKHNAFARIVFKRIWQLRYPPWNFGEAIELYKKHILSPLQFDPWLKFELTFFNYPSLLQLRLGSTMYDINEFARYYSPIHLYSLTLNTGDYRYIAAALRASVLAINSSLALGLRSTKIFTEKFLNDYKDLDRAAVSLATGFLANLVANAITGAICGSAGGPWGMLAGAIVGTVVFVIMYYGGGAETLVLNPAYDYLYYNSYSPTYLLNLVKITEYDLTLLNYEVSIWDQLKD
jgi:hypothetical protein